MSRLLRVVSSISLDSYIHIYIYWICAKLEVKRYLRIDRDSIAGFLESLAYNREDDSASSASRARALAETRVNRSN